jgi:CLIP-associating protein 1/2
VAIRDPAHTSPLAPLRPFTTLLLPLLGDQDPTVRSLALSSTITIFSAAGVTQPACADLKKAMIKLDVNKKVQETILAAVLGGGSGSMERTGSAASVASGSEKAGSGVTANGSHPSASTNPTSLPIARSRPRPPSPASLVASLPSAAFPSDPSAIHAPTTDVQPVYIADLRDLQTEFDRMKEGFEGKETEHNWMVRDRSIARIRGMVKGNVQERLLEPFLAAIKGVQDGINKTASRISRRASEIVAVADSSLLSTGLLPPNHCRHLCPQPHL